MSKKIGFLRNFLGSFGVSRSDDEQHRLPACSFSLPGEAFRQFQEEVVFYMRKKLFLQNPPAIPDFLELCHQTAR